MTATAPNRLTVTAADRESMDRQLDEAADAARIQALSEGRHGILVTCPGHDFFTVALSVAVPFGLTREHQAW
ncbi:hypothetical protein [Arthrobacter sp. ISL-72]|uniref:hypothetical protein n=1 Tax=Arthrobacter sp. ISL-72 TaxID=2819114 RepID=UPI001BE84B8A|nr:hypothetical protein [Arthrobacter sp. ISL-72]MBT2598085.1 hypothetical protein [Arthrobacter sp. ISL-72]